MLFKLSKVVQVVVKDTNSKAMKRETWKTIIQVIVSILTAMLTAMGTTSCMGMLR